jgi:hypothetical protein
MNAFRALDFSDLAVESIWKMVAVILHLGNIEFYADEKDHVGFILILDFILTDMPYFIEYSVHFFTLK